MKQIIVDNVHYCTLKSIIDLAVETPKEIKKRERNTNIKTEAKKYITNQEKLHYGDKYDEIVRERQLTQQANI